MKQIISFFLTILILTSCTPTPQEINYGKDACSYCKMNIIDQLHAAEYVTTKGKVFKFDAIECMLHSLKEKQFPEMSFLLVSAYEKKGGFIDAQKSFFLISEAIPSPMGGFLTAFEEKNSAQETLKEKGGKLYTWDELKSKFSNEN